MVQSAGFVRRCEIMLAEIPDDLDDPPVEKAVGVVRLPPRLDWSDPRPLYDLADPAQRRHVYGKVIREGSEEDLRFYIDVDELIELWPIVVPRAHTAAWIDWVRRHRGVTLTNLFEPET